MVFESVLVDILNRYLRPYVKRLDPSQIKVGVWKGELASGLRLQNVQLAQTPASVCPIPFHCTGFCFHNNGESRYQFPRSKLDRGKKSSSP